MVNPSVSLQALSASSIRVVLADDHTLFREGVKRILKDVDGIEVVGEAATGRDAIQVARELEPDVLVLDYQMPDGDAAMVTEQLNGELKHTRILVLSMHANVHYALKILELGAAGFMIKTAEAEELTEAIRSVHRGMGFVSPTLVPFLANQLSAGTRSEITELSPREFQILRYLGKGLSQAECADDMGISPSAVSTYRARLMKKLGLRTTGEVIKFALENGIVG